MAGHAKAVICYENAFWREADYSGSAYAAYPGAILGEMFDAGTTDGKIAALAGFFTLPATLREQYRKDLQTFILSLA